METCETCGGELKEKRIAIGRDTRPGYAPDEDPILRTIQTCPNCLIETVTDHHMTEEERKIYWPSGPPTLTRIF